MTGEHRIRSIGAGNAITFEPSFGAQVHKHLGDVDGGGTDLVAGPAQESAYIGAARSARLAV
jgi:hypothetical protein